MLIRNFFRATDFLMYEVLVEDRAEWAVCGRAVGVVDMGHASKQTSVVVEVMALNGGHLLIPRVQIMKYFPASSAGQRQSTTSQIELKGKEPPAYIKNPNNKNSLRQGPTGSSSLSTGLFCVRFHKSRFRIILEHICVISQTCNAMKA